MAAVDMSPSGESTSPRTLDHINGDLDHLEHARPRKRTKRACDKCSISRTRCDGQYPCRRCEDYGYTCRYQREIKKRGRVPAALSGNSQGDSPLSLKDGGDLGSPSPPITSPENSTGSNQYTTTKARHRESLSDVQPQVSGPRDAESPIALSTPTAQMPPPISTAPVATFMDPTPLNGARTHIQLATILDPSSEVHILPRNHESVSQMPQLSAVRSHEEVLIDGTGAAFLSSASTLPPGRPNVMGDQAPSFSTAEALARPPRSSFSDRSATEEKRANSLYSLYKAPSAECRHRFLQPILPYIRDIIPASVACDLLDVYLTEPGSSLFRVASPYILTRIFRKKSIIDPVNPRPTTPALLATLLWCAVQTADIVLLHVPGSRSKITNALYELSTSLISERDPDRWRRIHGGLTTETEQAPHQFSYGSAIPATTATNEPGGLIDDVLTFILLAIAVSGGDFKSDCVKWWNKAVRLAIALRLNREDERCSDDVQPCANPICSCKRDQDGQNMTNSEAREERRRVFWLIYCLDRHLALSYNSVLLMPDSYCEVFAPLPETVWEKLDEIAPQNMPVRVLGPPDIITGTGYFEYFLPLMAILGDIIEVHHRRQHPRLGMLDDHQAHAVISESLVRCERSLEQLQRSAEYAEFENVISPVGPTIKNLISAVPMQPTSQPSARSSSSARARDRARLQLVTAYSTHILHVLHVLQHGKWDAICMLDDDDDWITSASFNECASHAIQASQAVSDILKFDPELTFMPYLFGIYLLHGSFILLLFADRMPQLGPNQSVEQACEVIIRAHEVCVVTLSTEFQKNFRKVLRSTLYSVRGSSPTEWEEHKARRRALSLYRWTKGSKGLAL